jgi:hypothetical protein
MEQLPALTFAVLPDAVALGRYSMPVAFATESDVPNGPHCPRNRIHNRTLAQPYLSQASLPRMRRLWRVATFAFGKPASGAAQWGPLALTVLGTAATAVGLALPKPGGYWLAIAGIASLCVVLFFAAFRLHVAAFPDFPEHRFTHGPLWILDRPEADKKGEKLVVFSVDFTNREPSARIHLTVDLWWVHDFNVEPRKGFWRSRKAGPLGPFRFWAYRGGLGRNVVLARPTDVAPHGRAEGLVAFEIGVVPGLEVGDEASDLRAAPDLRLYARLIDDVSGAEHDVDVNVQRTVQE